MGGCWMESRLLQLAPSFFVGDNLPVFIIAEAGNNHNGDVENAKKLISAAKKSGAHCVKFQKRSIPHMLTTEALEAPYESKKFFRSNLWRT